MYRSVMILCSLLIFCCGCASKTSDDVQREQQEKILMEGTSQVGMPAIKNFREKRMLKDILELRDQEGLVTYTYIFSAFLGKFIFVGETIGYPIPASTQYTNPQKITRTVYSSTAIYSGVIAQADPNGLFSPSSSEATWILMKDPNGSAVKPVYVEERVSSFPFKLAESMVFSGK